MVPQGHRSFGVDVRCCWSDVEDGGAEGEGGAPGMPEYGVWDGCHSLDTKRGPVCDGDGLRGAAIDGVVLRDVDVRGNRQPFSGRPMARGPLGPDGWGRGYVGAQVITFPSLVWAVGGRERERGDGRRRVSEVSLEGLPKSS